MIGNHGGGKADPNAPAKCPFCGDTGSVSVPESAHVNDRGEWEPQAKDGRGHQTMSVSCRCDHGVKAREKEVAAAQEAGGGPVRMRLDTYELSIPNWFHTMQTAQREQARRDRPPVKEFNPQDPEDVARMKMIDLAGRDARDYFTFKDDVELNRKPTDTGRLKLAEIYDAEYDRGSDPDKW